MASALKETLYTREIIEQFAGKLGAACSGFSNQQFTNQVFSTEWDSLELKQRMRHITKIIFEHLPKDYAESISILMKISPDIHGFIALSFSDFVECYGLHDWDLSMKALAWFTQSCSSEFAIRPFLDANPKAGIKQMQKWATDENEHVRRLASEGCRPRLPWGMALQKFIKDPTPIIQVLEILKDDPSIYVRKSVANNMNDISKDHPEIILDLCEKWQGKSKNTDWIIKHACRSLLKSGNKRAMLLFGFGNPEKITINDFAGENNKVKIGQQTQFSFNLSIHEEKNKKVRLEYLVHFVKSSGKTSAKIFQISEKNYTPGIHKIKFKHSFQNLSTRKHFAGTHLFEVIVNGEKKAETIVEVIF